jgi:photosystem II stability/assembly factor-like uncharacterized protein
MTPSLGPRFRRLRVELLEDRRLLAASAPTDILLRPATVSENQPIGTSVGTLFSVDPDAGDTHTYSLVPGTGDQDNSAFEIDGNVFQTAVAFDYETKSLYSVRVQSTDALGLSSQKQLTITVADGNDVAQTDREDWLTQFGGPTSSTDDWRGVAADEQGNCYVVGWSDAALPGQSNAGNIDILVRKYDSAGAELWTRQFGSPYDDNGYGIAVDASGVYVTGFVAAALPGQTSPGGADAFLRKYDLDGTVLWTREFGTSSTDRGYGVVADSSGVYVTGYTGGTFAGQSSAGGNDVFLSKYDADGTAVWTRQFGSSASDTAYGVSADSSGVYVTGYTSGTLPGQSSSGGDDVFVQKYDSSGTALWTRQFGTATTDHANAVMASAAGVYVTGYTGGTLPGQTRAGASDAWARKYDAGGTVLWTRQFGTAGNDYGQGIGWSAAGVLVTGYTAGAFPGQTSAGGNDSFLSRLDDSTGTVAGTTQFGTVVDDLSFSLAAHAAVAFVAGYTYGTLPDQSMAWGKEAFTRKYDLSSDPAELWTRATTGDLVSTSDEVGRAVCQNGDLYVVGSTHGALPGQTNLGTQDVFVRKYNSAGAELWSRDFGTAYDDNGYGVAADSTGVYVVGSTFASLSGQPYAAGSDVFLRKYDGNGVELWTREFGSAASDIGYAVAVDGSGVYVTGYTAGVLPGQSSAGGNDAFVRKYDAAGTELWTRQFGSSATDIAYGVASDTSGAYVIGSTTGTWSGQTSAGGEDVLVRKLDPDGNPLWTRQFGTSGTDRGNAGAAGASGLYVIGYVASALPGQTGSGGIDAFLRNYTTDGTEVWTREFGSSSPDYGQAVAVDALGIYATGYTYGALAGQTSAGGNDAFVQTFDNSGTQGWTYQFGGSSNDSAYAITTDATGVYVAGQTGGAMPGMASAGGADVFFTRLRKADDVPPTVIGTTPALSAGPLAAWITSLQVNFREPVTGEVANYDLRSSGPDAQFDTADDVIYPVTVTYVGSAGALAFPPLPVGDFRMTARDPITDLVGNRLDGDGDGAAGGDWTGLFSTCGGGPTDVAWRNIGPGGGGAIMSVAASAFDPDDVLVGSDVGGFYGSDDAGVSYTVQNDGLQDPFIERIVEHPTNPNILYLATRGGVHRSNDGGHTWQLQRNGFPALQAYSFSAPVGALVIDPTAPDTLYAGIGEPWYQTGGLGAVYKTTDGGAHWVKVNAAGSLASDALVSDLLIDATNHLHLILACQYGVYQSTDGGVNWTQTNAGLPHAHARRLAVCASQPQVVYVTLYTTPGQTPWQGGVYRSNDGGLNWLPCLGGLNTRVGNSGESGFLTANYDYLAVDPANPDLAYVAGTGWLISGGGVWRTVNGGASWTLTTVAGTPGFESGWLTWGLQTICLAMSPVDSRRLYFGTQGGLWRSDDGGDTWHEVYSRLNQDGTLSGTGLETTCIHNVFVSPTDARRVFVTYYDIGLLVSTDGGQSFRRSMSGVPFVISGDAFALLFDPADPARVWGTFGSHSTNIGGLCVSNDGAQTWTVIATNLPNARCRNLMFDPSSPGRVLAMLDQYGVYACDDISNAPGTWYACNTGLPYLDIRALVAHPSQPGMFWCALGSTSQMGGVYCSTDGGRNWQQVGAGLPATDIATLAVAPSNPNRLYLSTRQSYTLNQTWYGGVLRSDDGGQTWQRILTDWHPGAIAVDPEDADRVYVGLSDSPYHDLPRGRGIKFSVDGGVTWQSLNGTGLSCLDVRAIVIDPHETRRLYLGTAGNGLFVNDLPPDDACLDVDGNGAADALTDGILILRYLFNPGGAWNVSDALGCGAMRTARSAIQTFLDAGRTTVLDVDGNGTPDALTDGILILRYLFAPPGQWNYSDALGSGATRTTREMVRSYLEQFTPGHASAGLDEIPVTRSAVISAASTAPCPTSYEAASADKYDESLVAINARPFLLAKAEPDIIVPPQDRDHAQPVRPTETAVRQASDLIVTEWSQNTARIEEPLTGGMSNTRQDDAAAVDDLCAKGGLNWLLMNIGRKDSRLRSQSHSASA